MAVIYLTEAEAASDFTGLLTRVRAGIEVVIGKGTLPAVVLRVAHEPSVRRLSHSLFLAKENGSVATLDEGFWCDLERVIESHPETLHSAWD